MPNSTEANPPAAPITRLMADLQASSSRTSVATSIEGAPQWLSEGRYVLKREVARGGMGCVYLCYDQELEREVALKVLLPQVSTDPMFEASFIEEARAVGQLEHPNIMPVYDLGMAPNDDLFFTMKFVEGETLTTLIDRLRQGDPDTLAAYPFSTRLRIIIDVAEALAFAHSNGIMHRDIKPTNIMLGPFGEVTVMDWGLARRARPAATEAHAETRISRLGSGATLATMSAGTPGYIAPEALQDSSHYDERCDVYSLGVLMYELFVLQSPYPGKTPDQLLTVVFQEDPTQADDVPTKIQGRVPKEIALIIRKAMARDPQQRYGGPRALIYAIQQYQGGEAPVVCVHTGLKRAVYSFAKLVDEHGHLVIVILSILLASPFILALVWWIATHV